MSNTATVRWLLFHDVFGSCRNDSHARCIGALRFAAVDDSFGLADYVGICTCVCHGRNTVLTLILSI